LGSDESPTVLGVTASSSTTKTDDEQDAGTTTEPDADATDDATESQPADATGADAASDADAASGEASDDAAEKSEDDAADAEPDEPVRTGGGSSLAAGAAAVVSAGLGLASITGTWLSDLMSSRQELIGQINSSQEAPPAEQLATIYGSPWHTTALFNGFFAIAALIAAGLALLLPVVTKTSKESPTWVRAVAIGGLTLGVLGLAIAATMWFEPFTDLPTVPEQPAVPQG
jgi:hypothetical protein